MKSVVKKLILICTTIFTTAATAEGFKIKCIDESGRNLEVVYRENNAFIQLDKTLYRLIYTNNPTYPETIKIKHIYEPYLIINRMGEISKYRYNGDSGKFYYLHKSRYKNYTQIGDCTPI